VYRVLPYYLFNITSTTFDSGYSLYNASEVICYYVSGFQFGMQFECEGVAVPLGLEIAPTPGVEHRQIQSAPEVKAVKLGFRTLELHCYRVLGRITIWQIKKLLLREVEHIRNKISGKGQD